MCPYNIKLYLMPNIKAHIIHISLMDVVKLGWERVN